jgi:hypothetical protein
MRHPRSGSSGTAGSSGRPRPARNCRTNCEIADPSDEFMPRSGSVRRFAWMNTKPPVDVRTTMSSTGRSASQTKDSSRVLAGNCHGVD